VLPYWSVSTMTPGPAVEVGDGPRRLWSGTGRHWSPGVRYPAWWVVAVYPRAPVLLPWVWWWMVAALAQGQTHHGSPPTIRRRGESDEGGGRGRCAVGGAGVEVGEQLGDGPAVMRDGARWGEGGDGGDGGRGGVAEDQHVGEPVAGLVDAAGDRDAALRWSGSWSCDFRARTGCGSSGLAGPGRARWRSRCHPTTPARRHVKYEGFVKKCRHVGPFGTMAP
jgi:hypothetical protein